MLVMPMLLVIATSATTASTRAKAIELKVGAMEYPIISLLTLSAELEKLSELLEIGEYLKK